MIRVKRGVTAHARHKKILDLAKGSRGRAKSCFRTAIQRVEKSLLYAYRDRKQRKRQFRSLWIVRINAATRALGIKYSDFIHALKTSSCDLNRKILADMAMKDPEAFQAIAHSVQAKKTLVTLQEAFI
jgi:large subunit ribosomal protein L20